MVRNHLVESQVVDGSWLENGSAEKGSDPFCAKHPSGRSGKRGLTPFPPDTDQFTCRQVGERMVGGYAGWSSPVHILAACETLHWGGPELRNKTRAFQNCCGGSGTHGFYIAWKNAARFEDGTLSVNLHIDKLLPEAEIRGYQPYKGLLTIDLKRPCKVRVRIPEFVEPGEMKVEGGNSGQGSVVRGQDSASDHTPPAAGNPLASLPPNPKPRVWGNYLELGDRQAGERIEVSYPLPLREETESVGNPGFRQYRYRVAWRGDTVVRLTPVGDAVKQKTGYSEYAHKQVQIFFGAEGPGPLYQRDYMLHETADPTLTPLHMDDGRLDFWSLRGERGERRGEGEELQNAKSKMANRPVPGMPSSLILHPSSLPASLSPLPSPLSSVQALADQLPCTVDFFEVSGCRAFLIRPRGPLPVEPLPWVWYAPVIDNPNPTHAWMLRQWLAKGIGMAGVDVGESFGNPRGRAVFTKLWETLRAQYHVDPRPCLLAQSRGGLMLYNWAVENPARVACIAGIYPVCDLRSFPRLERACAAYGLTAAELRAHLAEHNPIDRLASLAKANVPILHVHGDTDRVVPIEPNSAELGRRYRALGGTVRLIVVPHQGHQESDQFFHCQELVDFVIANLTSRHGG
jgi:pimeloyl-ACP methyl ester carboxylesterase